MAISSMISLRALAAFAIFIVIAAIYQVARSLKKPKLLAGAPYAGLDGGKRSLEEARIRYLSHGGEMIQEGYDMVRLNCTPA